MVKPLTVYKASAGSGKTFTLATEYIKLLVMNPQSYRNILAVTFTNKATEEMKTRILSQLYGIWQRLPQSDSYMQAICRKTGQTEQFVSQRAGMALTNLLHNYSYFRVETIDTFFQRVLRNLARELDLTANLRIGLNDTQVEELAVDQLIEELSASDLLLQWLLRYIMDNIDDDKSWNVIGQVKAFGRTIFRDDYKRVGNALSQKMAEPDFYDTYSARLKDIRRQAAERMREIAEAFFDTLEGEGLSIDDISYGRTGLCSLFLKLRAGIFDESIVAKRATDAAGDPDKWCKKSHPRRELIHSLAEGSLGDILRYALDERPRQWKLYKSADLTLRHLTQLRLLGSIEQKVRQLNDEANRFLLSDTQQLLHALIDGSDSPFIFEKIGTQLEHVMIDEFQDTSTVQWQNFKVLLSETMSHEATENLIVGDVKQSIYRWRSGDWRLLNDIQSQFTQPQQQLDVQTLDTNYRSLPGIIQFNNAFFQQAAQLEYDALQHDNPDAQQLQRAYSDVCQAIPEKRLGGGSVSVSLLTANDYQQQVLSEVADSVDRLMHEGVRPSQMCILVRTNSLIPIIAEYFTQQLPQVRIVSDEAFRLDASLAVGIIIQALRLLSNPDDMLAKATIAKNYQHCIAGSTAADNEMLLAGAPLDDLLPEAFTAHRDELITLPLYELVERLYDIFSLSTLDGQSAYVCAFYDQLQAYVSDNATDIDAFLNEWEENLAAKTIQSDEIDGLRLISIHKSKGLEFDHVILPFCDWQLEKQGNIIWCRPSEAPFDELPIAPIDYSQKQMAGTIYEADYLQEHLQCVVDNLNLLYVAFTRACRSLCVIGRRNAKASRSALIEQTLPLIANQLPGSTLTGLDDDQSPIRFSYSQMRNEKLEMRNDDYSQGGKDSASKGNHHSSFLIPHSSFKAPNPFLQKSQPLKIAIETFPGNVTFRQSNRSRDFIMADDEEQQQQRRYIQTGSVLHEIFSTISTADDIDRALQRLQLEGVIYDDHITPQRIADMLRQRLQDPRVASWFSARWTLFNECTILTVEGGQVVERRPDRVMTDGQEWIVVDFKFGSPKPEYHDQVRQYMQLLASMGHTRISGYLWYVYSNRIVEVEN